MEQHLGQTKQIVDFVSIPVIVATFVGWLPQIAAGLTVFWWLIRIYETDTVQKWVHRKRPAGKPGGSDGQ